jgi:5-methylcytosine-specific restriction endonuclease McrA
MSPMGQNLPRLRLDPISYESLRQQVLRRDGWRCPSRGTMSNLEVHHKRFRSHSGDDSEQNLITQCSTCHASVHGQKNKIVHAPVPP